MELFLISPAKASLFGIPTIIFSILIPLTGIALFVYIIMRRIAPIIKAAPDYRFDRIPERIFQLLNQWLTK